jgi:cytochrome c oxidase subunit II
MAIGATLILVVVGAMVLYAVYRAPERRLAIDGGMLIVGGGLLFPTVVLTALLVYGSRVGERLVAAPAQAPLLIEVVGRQWWWEVRYPHSDQGLVTANEIHVPVGRDVEVAIESGDVIHSFWVPQLAGKTDLIPGRINRVAFRADRAGVFRGQCAEFCGLLHAHMRFVVVAHDDDGYRRWLAARAAPTALPAGRHPAALRSFVALGCSDCHRLRGLTAGGDGRGPDLTHYGARIDPREAPTAAGRAQLAVWLQQRHAAELAPRHGAVAAPDAGEAEALAAMLEALQ